MAAGADPNQRSRLGVVGMLFVQYYFVCLGDTTIPSYINRLVIKNHLFGLSFFSDFIVERKKGSGQKNSTPFFIEFLTLQLRNDSIAFCCF